MKKTAIFVSLIAPLLLLSLFTAALATAKTAKPDPSAWTKPAPLAPLQAFGGPDTFGYTYQDEAETNGPTFSFIDISGTGANLNLDDDDSITITIPFSFTFYGVSSSDIGVGNNGALRFNVNSGKANFDNSCPLSGAPADHQNIIAPWWDDWGDGGNVFWEVQGSAPNRRLIVQWHQMIHLNAGGIDGATFEAILFETSNVILFQYADTDVTGTVFDNGNSGTVGIRANSVANTLQYEACTSPVLANNRVIRFQHSLIIITKDAIPDAAQNFSFTGTGAIGSFSLDDDADGTLPNSRTFSLIPSNYTVTEASPSPAWGLSNLACASSLVGVAGFTGTTSMFATSVSTRTAGITSLAPGDTVSCIFTNNNFGTVVINKATIPISDTQLFTFTNDITGAFSLNTDPGPSSQTFTNLIPGSYFVQENALADWDLTGLTCTDPGSTVNLGTRRADINVAAGEIVTCTFTNTKRGAIVITKATSPITDTQDFTFTGSSSIGAFSLDTDTGDPTLPISQTFGNLISGTYIITEGAVVGWNLTDLACADPSGGTIVVSPTITIGLAAGETVTCTFTNTKRGLINIVKDSLPDHPQDFTFTTAGPDTIPPFDLDDDPGDVTLPVSQTLSVSPSLYTVTESAVANWTVSAVTCIDPTSNSTGDTATRAASINVAPGEIITCTFTNLADDGNLIVEKATLPVSDPQVFTFTSSIPTTPTFTLDTNAGSPTPISRTFVISTGTYTVGENGLPDWDLTSATCSDGSTVNNVDVAPGETVTCTFTNTKRATIVIDKVTSPGSDAQDFSFTSSDSAIGSFSLDTDPGSAGIPISRTFVVPSGSYTITEGVVAGWDLADLTCNDTVGNPSTGDTVTRAATIDVSPGETVSCTFTNTRRGVITIVKDAQPNHPQDFGFTGSGSIGAFSLDDDPGDLTLLNSQTFPDLVAGTYIVTETLPVTNWTLTDIGCVDPSGGTSVNIGAGTATLAVAPGETVTCTFTNLADPSSLIVEKVTDPVNDSQVFTFTSTMPSTPTFTLDTDPGSVSIPVNRTFVLSTGTYAVIEGGLSDWDLTGLSCPDASGGSSVNLGGRTANVDLAPGETVTCTFTNTKRATIIITKATDPTPHAQDFAFTASAAIGNFSLDTDSGDATLPVSRTFFVPPSVYTVTEAAVTGWDLTGLTCNDTVGNPSSGNVGTRTATIDASAGETITCTFTNTAQPGSITIRKNAIPNDPQDFAFLLTGVSTTTNFMLDDDSDPTLPLSRTFTSLTTGSYTIIEGATSGWSLTSINCVDPSGGTTTNPSFGLATIALAPGENVTCTFNNTFNTSVGSITIVKSAVPTSTQSFTFTGTFSAFSLVDDGTPPNSQSFLNLNPGAYNVIESLVAGWGLTGLTCNDPDNGSIINLGTRTATIDLDAGENVTCTFTNTANPTVGSITIVKSAVPTSTQNFTFTGTLGAFSLVDDGTPPNSQTFSNRTPGAYNVTESAVISWNLTGLTCNDPDSGSSANLGTGTATIDLDAGENVTCTFTNSFAIGSAIYLPIIMKDFVVAPDLTITNFTVTGSNPNRVVTIVVQNGSSTSTGEGFWVDFYVNPATLPNNPALGGNRRWELMGSTQGIAWPVPALNAGQSVTLTSNGALGTLAPAPAPLSNWTGTLPSGSNNLYAFVDSFAVEGTSFVEIAESNENNNLASLVIVAATGLEIEPSSVPDLNNLPPRWKP